MDVPRPRIADALHDGHFAEGWEYELDDLAQTSDENVLTDFALAAITQRPTTAHIATMRRLVDCARRGGMWVVSDPYSGPDYLAHEGDSLLAIEAKRYRSRTQRARKRLEVAVCRLIWADTVAERRSAAREFLAAIAELVAQLLGFFVRVVMLLLSRALGRTHNEDVLVWRPEPIDETPQIAPRGPNPAFPVTTYRGGHRCSALGSAVLAA